MFFFAKLAVSFLLVVTSINAATTPCVNGVDGTPAGQFAGWTCAGLAGLLLGPGQGYCTMDDLSVACCVCVDSGDTTPTTTPATVHPTAQVTTQPVTLHPTSPTTNPVVPTNAATSNPTPNPTANPTAPVTPNPTANPTPRVTSNPTDAATTASPTAQVTPNPTASPTPSPTAQVTPNPTSNPTAHVTSNPVPNPTPSPTNAGTTSPPPSGATDSWNVCYFTNWARYRNGEPNEGKDVFEMDFPADLCTHFMYGFATVTQDFDVMSNDPNADHPSGHMGQTELCDPRCNDPNFTTDWSDPNGLRCDWPCNPTRKMRGYEAMNVGMKQKNPNIKSLISVGGWNFNDCAASPSDTVGQGYATCEIFSTIASSEANIRQFAKNVIKFTRKWGFDGFDLDWEYPVVAGHNSAQMYELDGSPAAYNINRLRAGELVFHEVAADRVNYINMLRIMKEEFHNENPTNPLLLTAAVGVGKSTVETAYDIPNMSKYLDQINLMTYDMHGGWESRTGCNANLYATAEDVEYGGGVGAGEAVAGYPLSVSWAVDYWLDHGAKPEQLTMGLGTYGRGWKLQSMADTGYNAPVLGVSTPGPSSGEAGYLAYYEIAAKLFEGTATRHYDYDRECPYIVTDDGEWIGYDDEQSYLAKMNFLKSRNLRGTMVWALDLDDFTGHLHGGASNRYPLIQFARDELKDYSPAQTSVRRRLQGY